MADSSVLLEVIVEGKNIKLVQRDIEELGSSINKSSMATEKDTKQKKKNKKATDELAAGSKNYNKGQKGVAGATANGTKAFSKQREAIGGGSSGLVGAYATLAANIFAATAAFGALQRAAQFQKLLDGFETIAATSGRTSSIITENLRKITDGALSTEQAASAAAAGINAGFSNLDVERLGAVAKNAAIALGRNIPDAIDRVIRGTAKLEPEILDELGLFVRLDEAVEKFATQLGKSATSLTQAERRQAFLNETLSQGELKFAALDGVIEPDKYSKLAASFDDLTKTLLGFFSNVAGPFITLLSTNVASLVGVLVLFSTTIASQVFPFLTKLGSKFVESSEQASKAATKIAKSAKKAQKEINKEVGGIEQIGNAKVLASIKEKASKGELIQAKELQKAENSIAGSIAQKTGKIRKGIKARAGLTAEARAELKVEIQNLRTLRQQLDTVQALKKADQERAKAEAQAAKIKRRSEREGGVGDRINTIQTGGAFGGFGEATKGVKEYNAELGDLKEELSENLNNSKLFNAVTTKLGVNKGKLADKVVKLSAGLRLGSVGVRLFGAAVVNALPVIGQIIFALGLIIQGATSLFRKLYPVNEGIEELGKISEGTSKKIETLEDGIKNYSRVLKKQLTDTARALDAQGKLTVSVEEYVKTQLALRVAAQEYRQEVKVLAGSLSEVDTAFSKATDQYVRQQEESGKLAKAVKTFVSAYKVIYGGLFQRVIDVFKGLITFYVDLNKAVGNFALDRLKKIGEGIKGVFTSIRDGLAVLQEGISGAFSKAWGVFSELFPSAAKAAESAADSIGNVASSVAESAGELASEAGTAVKAALDAAGTALSEGIALDQARGAGLTELQESLDGIAKQSTLASSVIEKAFGERGVEGVFIDAFRATGSLEEALDEVRRQVSKISNEASVFQGSFDGVTQTFAEFNTQAAKFKQKFDKKNPLTELDTSARNAVESLADLEEKLAGNTQAGQTFADQVSTLGINFENFGVSVEDVTKNGAEAFKPLLQRLDQYNTAVKTSKDETTRLKAELENLKIDFDADTAIREFNAKLTGFVKTGSFEVTIGDQLKVRLENLEAEKKFLEDKKKIDLDLVTQQYAVIRAELNVAGALLGAAEAITNAANGGTAGSGSTSGGTTTGGSTSAGTASSESSEPLTDNQIRMQDLMQQLTSIENAETAAGDAIRKRTEEAINRLTEQAVAAQIQQSKLIIDAAGQGDTTEDRSQSFFQAGGYEGIAAATEVAKTAFVELQQAKLAALTPPAEGDAAGFAAYSEKVKAIAAETSAGLSSIDTTQFRASLEATQAQLQPMIDNLKSLGPDGELVGSIAEGAFTIADSLAVLGDKGADTADKIAAVGGIVSAIGNIAKAASDAKIAGIDKEIAAEKKRDGKSKESLAKIKQLEAKKEAAKKKQFETDKKIKMATVIIDTAAAITRALAEGGPILGPILAGAMAALGAAQLAIISGTSYQGGGSAPQTNSGPSKVSVGERRSTVDLATSQSASGEQSYLRGQAGTGGPENFRPAFMGANYRANGGATAGYVVGEQGPELFVPNSPGTIVPNPEIGGGGAPINATFNINTIDASGVEEVLSGQRGNIIGMLRDSANSYGQGFFEEIDTMALENTSNGAARRA